VRQVDYLPESLIDVHLWAHLITMAQQPPVDQGLLIIEDLRSH